MIGLISAPQADFVGRMMDLLAPITKNNCFARVAFWRMNGLLFDLRLCSILLILLASIIP